MLAGNAAYTPPSFESIATSTPSGVSTITFSSIPSTYQHLQIRFFGIGAANNYGRGFVRFNGNTGANYSWHCLNGQGSAASASSGVSQTSMQLIGNNWGLNTSTPVVAILDIHDYASTTKNKTVRSFNGHDGNSSLSGDINLYSGMWMNTSAISSITIFLDAGNYGSSTSIGLYGIKGA
jgi:hypothetical protein